MIVSMVMLFVGISLLYLGAEGLIRGASQFALRFNISPLIIGLTVVACGTSLPEIMVNVMAQLRGGYGDIIMGNIIGSNISNIGLVLGASILIAPLRISKIMKKRDLPVLLIVCFLCYGVMLTGTISRYAGFLFIFLLIVYFFLLYHDMQNDSEDDIVFEVSSMPLRSTSFSVVSVIFGSAALFVGSRLLVDNAIAIAVIFDVPQRIIALTVVAIGTSLPELTTSLIATVRRHHGISMGNVIGSIVFNILFAIGGIACIAPISFSSRFVWYDAPVMLLFVVAIALVAFFNETISRLVGIVFLGVYVFYLITLMFI